MRNYNGMRVNMNCNNCEKSLAFEKDHLLVKRSGGDPIMRLCNDCTKDVLIMKIVLARPTADVPFSYEGVLPVSSVK